MVSCLALVALAGCSRGDDPSRREVADLRARQARAAAADAGLPADVGALLGVAARAPAATFSATYVAGSERIVVHQVPPRRRVDVVVDGSAREAVVIDESAGTAVTCVRPASKPWACESNDAPAGGGFAGGAFSPELVARTVEALADGADTYRTSVSSRTVAGVRASCLVSTPVAGVEGATTSQLCVAPDGVPLLVDRGDGAAVLRAVAYRPTAADQDVARPDR